MVETITPVVHGGRRTRYWTAVALHALGATGAAAVLGLVLGGTGALLGAPWGSSGLSIVALVAAAYAARELFGLPLPLFDRRRQVPEWWRTFYSPRVAAFLYGAGLGIGFLTFLTYGTFVAVAVAALALGDPVVGVALCAPFGAARGLSVTIGNLAGDSETVSPVVDRLEALAATGLPRAVNGVVLAVVAATVLLSGAW